MKLQHDLARIIGDELRDMRHPLTQRELADRVGITQAALSNYERGVRMPPVDLYVRLVEACEGTEDPDEALWSAVWEWHYRRDEPTSKRNRAAERERRGLVA